MGGASASAQPTSAELARKKCRKSSKSRSRSLSTPTSTSCCASTSSTSRRWSGPLRFAPLPARLLPHPCASARTGTYTAFPQRNAQSEWPRLEQKSWESIVTSTLSSPRTPPSKDSSTCQSSPLLWNLGFAPGGTCTVTPGRRGSSASATSAAAVDSKPTTSGQSARSLWVRGEESWARDQTSTPSGEADSRCTPNRGSEQGPERNIGPRFAPPLADLSAPPNPTQMPGA